MLPSMEYISKISIFRSDKVSAGRQVLLTHTFSFGRSVTVHKSAKDAL